jgi:hypothetical protein
MKLRFLRYARVVLGLVLCIAVFFLTDLVLAYTREQYERERARVHASLTKTESRRVEAIAASESNPPPIADLTSRQALGDTELHLAVGTGQPAPPPGARPAAQVPDDSYRWAAPQWVYVDRGSLAPGGNRQIPDTSRALAIFLESDAALYSQPAGVAQSDLRYVLPVRDRLEAPEPR